MKKTLITGGLGFVGQQLVKRLIDDGDRVTVCDLVPEGRSPSPVLGAFSLGDSALDSGRSWRYEGAAGSWDLYHCSLVEPEAVQALIEETQPEVVFHLAAQSSAGLSFTIPRETFSTNLLGTVNLFEAVRTLPAERRPTILSTGSCEEYGVVPGRTSPLSEDDELAPVSPYGISKIAQTKLGQLYQTAFDLPIIAVRAFNHIGPGQDTRFAFASFAAQIAAIEQQSAQAEIAVGDLSPIRDFLDVQDVLDAYCLLITKGRPGHIYNVCSGQALTIRQGLEILLQGACRPIEIKVDPARCRPSDIPYMVGNHSRLSETTGWTPRRDIGQTLASMLELARKEKS